MSPRVRTHTHSWTRLSALGFHSKRFMELAGISRDRATTISGAIERKLLSAVGVYAVDHTSKRVVEQEFAIDWGEHHVLTTSVPTIDASQPGWEDDLAVEVAAACARFRATVDAMQLSTSFWVTFVGEIRRDPETHKEHCRELGLSYRGSIPAWRGEYTEMSVNVSGLSEATIRMRVYEE